MRVAVSAMGNDLDAPYSPMFGRCPIYILVETDTLTFEAVTNQAAMAAGGAGIQAAQDVANRGARAVITGNMGPNAYQVFAAAGLPVYIFGGGTVRQAVEAYLAGRLAQIGGPTGPAHAGMGMMRGAGTGRGMAGRGMSRGMGGQAGLGGPTSSPQAPTASSGPAAGSPGQGSDVASLRSEVAELRDRLGKLTDRLEGQENR